MRWLLLRRHRAVKSHHPVADSGAMKRAALLVGVLLVSASCGDSGESNAAITTTTTTTAAPVTTTTVAEVVEGMPAAGAHVAALNSGWLNLGNEWQARVTVTVVDETDSPVAEASVVGGWDRGNVEESTCVTDEDGQCQLTSGPVRKNVKYVTLSLIDIGHASLIYLSDADTDPDTTMDGTSLRVRKP